MGNTYGNILTLTTFGESHGTAIGGILDGFPAGVRIDEEYIRHRMNLRRPGNSALTSTRKEDDSPEILSGVYDGISLGTPIGFIIRNKDSRPSDYDNMRDLFRPNHADFEYLTKYGIRDHRGGGRSSGRETACRVAAGAISSLALGMKGIKVTAFLSGAGKISLSDQEIASADLSTIDSSPIFAPDSASEKLMMDEIREAREAGDSIGGTVSCFIDGVPAGLGEPVFRKLSAMLADGIWSIGAVKGMEIGDGFSMSEKRGSEALDSFIPGKSFSTATSHCGGINGGISHGGRISLRVAFKPTPTISREVTTVDTDGREAILKCGGRHDPCVAVRGVQVVRAMVELTILDAYLLYRASSSF